MCLELGGLNRRALSRFTFLSGLNLLVCHIRRAILYQHFPNCIQWDTSCGYSQNILEESTCCGQISWGNILY